MKLYIKQCRPFQVSMGGQGFRDTWTPLEDWQDEDNENMLREKYPDELLQKKDAWSMLKFQYRFIEYEKFRNSFDNNSLKMRDATSEELQSVDNYIRSISEYTGIRFDVFTTMRNKV